MVVKGTTDPNRKLLIRYLKQTAKQKQAPIWNRLAKELERPRRSRPVVNVGKLNRFANLNKILLVPGKLLGDGVISSSVTVAAIDFSEQARKKITNAGGQCLEILELIEMNPTGQNVQLIT